MEDKHINTYTMLVSAPELILNTLTLKPFLRKDLYTVEGRVFWIQEPFQANDENEAKVIAVAAFKRECSDFFVNMDDVICTIQSEELTE